MKANNTTAPINASKNHLLIVLSKYRLSAQAQAREGAPPTAVVSVRAMLQVEQSLEGKAPVSLPHRMPSRLPIGQMLHRILLVFPNHGA
jgi:hypothetical protein